MCFGKSQYVQNAAQPGPALHRAEQAGEGKREREGEIEDDGKRESEGVKERKRERFIFCTYAPPLHMF